jgi:hypothetical protein
MDIYKTISKYGINKSTPTNGGNNSGNTVISRFGFNRKFTSFNNGNNSGNLVVSRFGLNAPKYKEENDNLSVSVKNLILPDTIPDTIPDTPTNFIFWQTDSQFIGQINNFNVTFDPSTTVEINWGDGNTEQINSDTNYNHTFA